MTRCLPLALGLAMLQYGPLNAQDYTVYIGTYTGPKSQGIFMASFDSKSGKLSAPDLAVAAQSPSFLALHPNRPILCAVGEGARIGPRKEGAVTSFAIQPNGRLTQLSQQPSGGGGPCHLAVDAKGTSVLVANYGSGSIAAMPLGEDGKLGEAKTVVQHKGSSVDQRRQAGPHAHQIVPDPAGRFALVCDLGLDQVLVYRMKDTAVLEPNEPPYGSVSPGAGPRHLGFHPNGRWVYVINEMGSSVTAFHYDGPRGALKEFQTISTLPSSFQGKSSCAEIEVHPSGKFLYGSNRGHDSVAVFSISDAGKLSVVEHEPCGGKTPRFIGIDPTGKWLLSANQDSDGVTVFGIDPATGALSPTNSTIEVGKPVCLVFHKR